METVYTGYRKEDLEKMLDDFDKHYKKKEKHSFKPLYWVDNDSYKMVQSGPDHLERALRKEIGKDPGPWVIAEFIRRNNLNGAQKEEYLKFVESQRKAPEEFFYKNYIKRTKWMQA